MTSKGAKETLVSRLGFKSSSSVSKAEAELEKVRKENAHLRKKVDEMAKRHIKPADSDKSYHLSSSSCQLLSQLEQRRREAEQRDTMFQSLSQETENLKNKLATVSARCQALEGQAANGTSPPADLLLVQEQLRDALEKNQQWLAYDQQREAYVQSVVARSLELEQQLNQQKTNPETTSEAPLTSAPSSSPGTEKESEMKSHYEELVLGLQRDLENQKDQTTRAERDLSVREEQALKAQAELQSQRQQVSKARQEMSALQRKYEDKCSELSAFLMKYDEKIKELDEVKVQLQAERLGNRHAANEERTVSDRMRAELESTGRRLDEERKRSAELLMQVNMLQKSLLSQNEERRRVAALEQQIQLSAKDFENEKSNRQSMQQQLHKVLKELRKAREQIAQLEYAKQPNAQFSEPSSYNRLEFDATSPSKVSSLLDESFLECPKCHTPYPASRHRELLVHIDDCYA
uniref:Centrosomal protein 55 like n=1 Tax=Nothobranchius kadleci TaxID=1051664 RepID=A0A1A8BN96_NOTKA